MPEFDPDRLGVFVVTYKRPRILATTLRAVVATTPSRVPVVVQFNHDDCELPDEPWVGRRVAGIRGPRPDDSPGHLAADWNFALGEMFGSGRRMRFLSERWQDAPADWIWCLHDDMVIEPGWIDVVAGAARDGVCFFSAPGGDMSFLLHRSVWETVGPWDERFLGTGWKEWDYYIRVLQALPRDHVVMEDTHGAGFAINHIGLSRFWRGKSGDGHLFAADPEWHQARGDKEAAAVREAHNVFVAKWGDRTMRDIEQTEYRCFNEPAWAAVQKAAW